MSTLNYRKGLLRVEFETTPNDSQKNFVSVRVHIRSDLPELFTLWGNFLQQLFRGLRRIKLDSFIVFSSPASTFSLLLKGFNIGQELILVSQFLYPNSPDEKVTF